MNDIDIQVLNRKIITEENLILSFIEKVLSKLNIDDWSFTLVFCDDEYIEQLNKDYRNKSGPTDVLTFSETDVSEEWFKADNDGNYYAGDIIISTDTLSKNAEYFKVNEKEELKRLIIHGILHLKGYDHKTNNTDEEMLKYQEEILKDLGDFEF